MAHLTPNTTAWHVKCAEFWAGSVDFWIRYQDLPQARSNLYHAQEVLHSHIAGIMRTGPRPEY